VVYDWLAQKIRNFFLFLSGSQEEVHGTWSKSLYSTYFCNKSLLNFSNLHMNDLCISNHFKFIFMSITEINLLVRQCSVICPKKISLCINFKIFKSLSQ
jgi:hypothetical protein